VHHVDAGKFADSGVAVSVYSSRDSMLAALRELLSGASKIAMKYSPENALPRVSRWDAGTIELVRSLGPEVVSSADLMQYATHQWSPEQLADHRETADKSSSAHETPRSIIWRTPTTMALRPWAGRPTR